MLLLTNTQVSRLCKTFPNGSSASIKLSKSQLNKIGQSGGFWGKLLGPLLKTELPLMKNVLVPLAKSVLIPLGLTAAASATDAAIEKKIFGSSMTLLISNEEINDTMKIVKSLEESSLLTKGINETIKNEAKEQKNLGFLSMLLGTLGSSLLENLLTGKGSVRAGDGAIATSQGCKASMIGPGMIRASQDFSCCLIL